MRRKKKKSPRCHGRMHVQSNMFKYFRHFLPSNKILGIYTVAELGTRQWLVFCKQGS